QPRARGTARPRRAATVAPARFRNGTPRQRPDRRRRPPFGYSPCIPGEGAVMRIHNLYTDASGQSHFRDIDVEWAEETKAGKLSKRLPATGIIFRQVQ